MSKFTLTPQLIGSLNEGFNADIVNDFDGRKIRLGYRGPMSESQKMARQAARYSALNLNMNVESTQYSAPAQTVQDARNQLFNVLRAAGLNSGISKDGVFYVITGDRKATSSLGQVRRQFKGQKVYFHPAWGLVYNSNRLLTASKKYVNFMTRFNGDINAYDTRRQRSGFLSKVRRVARFANNPALLQDYIRNSQINLDKYKNRVDKRVSDLKELVSQSQGNFEFRARGAGAERERMQVENDAELRKKIKQEVLSEIQSNASRSTQSSVFANLPATT